MLVVRADHVRRPPGGHRFPEGKVWLHAASVEELAQRIAQFRADNARPLGQPAREIAAYYQQKAPFLVRARADREDEVDDLQRVAVRTMAIASSPPVLWPASAPQAEARLPVCAHCPFQAQWPEGESTSYTFAADIRAAVLTQRRDYQEAGYCTHHQWPIALAQRLKEPAKYARDPVQGCFAHEPAAS